MLGRVPLAGAMLLVVACEADRPDNPEKRGELGVGVFRYECINSTDPFCPDGLEATDFPDRIGEGSLFDMSFSGPANVLVPASPEHVEVESDAFRAIAQGSVALLAQNEGRNQVVDFIHLTIARAFELRLAAQDGDDPTEELVVGDSEVVRARAVSLGGATLAGVRTFEWTSSDESVAILETSTYSAVKTVRGVAPGDATITVTSGELSVDLELTVRAAPPIDIPFVPTSEIASPPSFAPAVPPVIVVPEDAGAPDAGDAAMTPDATVDAGGD